ncbi:efflux RND transporter periplasmic adaptor subunit [Brucella sp. IR073]|uniref:efflux RND transporter periplasmic adaptor subunit n=1 Tax=unclassified Brucella TaxID=2632610 RepID=UPI003B98429C
MTSSKFSLAGPAAGIVFLVLAGSAALAQTPPPPQVSVVDVKPREVPLTYEYAARVSAFREVQVRARVGGILLHRNFTEGTEVKAGQVLFEIDPAPYEAELARAKAQLAQAEAQYTQSIRDAERAEQLVQQKVQSTATRDSAIATRDANAAAVAAAKAQVRTAELNLSYTKVTAPISGITSREQVPEGSLIGTDASSSLLTSITQLDPVYINFSFSDAEAAEIRRLLDVQEAKGGDPNKLKVKITFGDGQVYDHEGVIDFTSSSLDKETGTLGARAVVDNPDHRLIPGQFVRATIMGVTIDNAIVVPEAALMQGSQGQFVYVVGSDGKAQMRPVTVNRTVEGGWLVSSGLNPGDRVVTEGVMKVRPGAPVTVDTAAADGKNVNQASVTQ